MISSAMLCRASAIARPAFVAGVSAATLLLAGCASGSTANVRHPGGPAPVSVITLHRPNSVPGLFKRLGLGKVFALPSGWSVDDTAASASGRWLAFSVYRTGSTDNSAARREDTWVTDTATGQTRRFPLINAGWYGGTGAVVGSWLLRREMQQIGDSSSYKWRLYAQPISSDRPILLAQSNGAVSMSWVPTLPAVRGDTAVWVVGASATRYEVDRWRPGQRHPQPVTTLESQADPIANDHAVYLDRYLALRANGEPPVAVGQLDRDGSVHPLVTVSSSAEPVVAGNRLVYFPHPGDGQGRWMLRVLTASGRPRPIGSRILGAYFAVPVNDHQFISWWSDQYDVVDVNTGRQTTIQRGTINVSVPRMTGTTLSVAVNQPKQIAVVGEGTPRLKVS